jgi:large subunit ribosomal protein L15
MAGLHKHKFKWMIKYAPDHFGRHGFVRHHDAEAEVRTIDLEAVEQNLARLVEQGHARESAGAVEIDLGAAGIGKLLGSGRVGRPLRITVGAATPGAIQKVAAAGGEVRVSGGA